MRKSPRYGWIKQRPDFRDYKFAPKPQTEAISYKVDLTETGFMPPVYNQGQIGSCTANAIAAAVDYERKKQGEEFITPSRLFIYANERLMEGTDLGNDSGAQIRDGIKSVSDLGVCPESLWPYHENAFNIKPPQNCYDEALNDKAIQYHSVDSNNLMVALAQGNPVTAGITIYDSFEWPQVTEKGIVPMPKSNEHCLGGHAILLVGYDMEYKIYIARNSWGSQWGQNGYFSLPFDYVHNADLASDFWVITQMS
jgi:C1A family cysteine protease